MATVLPYLHMQKECKAYRTFGAVLLLLVLTRSGYIYHVFKKFGHNISRQSVAGYWSSLPQTSSPQPGDLIYFKDTYKAGPSLYGYLPLRRIIYQAGDKGVAIASL